MKNYVVEGYVPGVTVELVAEAAARARSITAAMRAEGLRIYYLGSTLLPEDETCFCWFQAGSIDDVEEASRRADLAVARVLEAVSLCISPVHDCGGPK